MPTLLSAGTGEGAVSTVAADASSPVTIDDVMAAPDPLALVRSQPDPPPSPDISTDMETRDSGIPFDASAPIVPPDIGPNPWDMDDAAYEKSVAEWRLKYQEENDRAALDPDAFYKDVDLSFARDSKQGQILATNDAFLQLQNDGDPLPPGDMGRKLFRQHVAWQLFEGRGADSEEAFHTEIVKAAQRRKDSKEVYNALGEAAMTAVAVDLGKPRSPSEKWAVTRAEISKMPGFKNIPDADLQEAYYLMEQAAADEIAPFASELTEVFKSWEESTGAGEATGAAKAFLAGIFPVGEVRRATPEDKKLAAEKSTRRTAYEIYDKLSPEEQPKFLNALGIMASKLPKEQRNGFFANIAQDSGRALESLAQGVVTNSEVNGTITWADITGRNPEDSKAYWQAYDHRRRRADFVQKLQNLNEGTYNPTKKLSKSWLGQLGETIAYGTPGVIATSAAATNPYTGAALFSSLTETHYQSLLAATEGHMGYEKASRFSAGGAPIAAALETASEGLQASLLRGKLPFLDKALTRAMDSIANPVGRGAIRFVAGGAESGAQEIGQNYIDSLIQGVSNAFGADTGTVVMPSAQENVEAFASVFPLALMGIPGAAGRDARVKAFDKASDLQIIATGYANVKAIRDGIARGLDSGAAAIDAQQRNPETPEAIAAQKTLQAQLISEKQAAELAQMRGLMPQFVPSPDGIRVIDSKTGDEIGIAENGDEAVRLASRHTEMIDEQNVNQVAFLASLIDAGAAKTDEKSRVTIDPFKVLTAAQQASVSEADEAQIMAQSKAAEAMGREPGMSDVVFGKSVTEFKQRARKSMNSIYAGGSVLTVVHEDTHGFFEEALEAGRLTIPGTIATIRGLQSGFREGTQLLPSEEQMSGMSPDDQRRAVREAVSELSEVLILKTRKGGPMLPAGLISKNLSAMAKMDPQAKSFKGFVDTVRDYFGLVFSRLYDLKKSIKDGTVKESDLHEFTSKLFGLDQQDEHLRNVSDIAGELTGVPYQMEEGDPFSLGSSRMLQNLNSNAITRIQSPAKRHQAMARLSALLENLRQTYEGLELIAGVKRLKKSIRTEARRIEERRLTELEAKIHNDFQSVLSDDSLQKIKEQPGHALLAVTKADGTIDHLHGRLMSLAAASKKHPDLFQIHRPGDFDGADGISRTVFGGNLMPDQAAQEMYDAGLIKEPTPDALWDLLRQEQDFVTGMKEQAQKAKDRMREARHTAKQEANDWLATQVDHQQAHFSEKQELLKGFATLDAILSVVPPHIRGKIGGYTQLAKLGSNETMLAFLEDRLGMLDREIERWLKTEYDREFRELLKKAKPEKDAPGEKPKGKITASVHDLFTSIRKAMGMSAGDVEAEAVKLEAQVASGEYSPEEENHKNLEANLIRLAGNWINASAARREMALKEATSVYEKGYLARQKEISMKREETKNRREDLAAGTGKAGTEVGRKRMEEDGQTRLGTAKKFFLSLLGWEQIVGYSFGDLTPEAIRLVDMERAAANTKADALHGHWDGIEELFIRLAGGKGRYEKTFAQAALKGQQIRARLSERRQPIDSKGKAQTPKGIKASNGIYYSEMEAIQATLMWMQEDGKRHMLGHQDENGNHNGEWHYDQDFVDSLEDGMSEEAKAVRLHLMQHYAAEYDRLNPIYKKLNGVNLPRHKFYSPLTVKPLVSNGSTDAFDPVTGAAMSAQGFTPGSLKTRSEAISEPDFRDALQTFERHVMQMEHWMAYAEFSNEANQVLNNRTLKNAVKEKAGAEAVNLLEGWVKLFAAGGTRDASAHLAATQAVGSALNRAATTALVGRASVLAVQSVQLGSAINAMPTGSYINRLAKLTTGNLGWGDAIGSEYIQRRLKDMPPVVRQALAGLHTGTPNQLKHQVARIGTLIGGADALFTAGTYAMIYDYQLTVVAKSRGLSGQEAIDFAHRETERETDRVAQPTRAGTRSYYENVSTSPAMKLAWSFASEPRQKMALMVYNLGRKDVSTAQKARTVFLAYGVGGVLATVLRAAVRDLRDGGDDDEVFDERNWNLGQMVLQAFTSPLQGIPFVGDGLQAIGAKLSGQYAPDGNLFTAVDKAATAAVKIKGHIEEGETARVIRDVEDILTGFALGSDNATAAASIMHILRDLYGVSGNIVSLVK